MLSQSQPVPPPAVSPILAGRLMAASAMPETQSDTLPAWQSLALAAYAREARMGGVGLRAQLVARVQALTGCALPDSSITVDPDARRATAAMDGVVFQFLGRDLVLLRPCAHCGAGRFASPPISSRADLGHALSGWQPYHTWCEPVDPADVDW